MAILRVVAGLLERGPEVLIARRAHPPAWAGWWEFPGGKVEAGETDEHALARELAEELDVDVEVGAPLVTVFHDEPAPETGLAPQRRIAISVYRAALRSGEPRAVAHDALAWVAMSALATYKLLPADLVVLQALADCAGG